MVYLAVLMILLPFWLWLLILQIRLWRQQSALMEKQRRLKVAQEDLLARLRTGRSWPH
jgi:hypothetical protein